jgi:hypothetical protein
LKERLELTQIKQLLGAPLKYRLQVSATNIRLVWKGIPGMNTPAYFELLQITDIKSFASLGAGKIIVDKSRSVP